MAEQTAVVSSPTDRPGLRERVVAKEVLVGLMVGGLFTPALAAAARYPPHGKAMASRLPRADLRPGSRPKAGRRLVLIDHDSAALAARIRAAVAEVREEVVP